MRFFYFVVIALAASPVCAGPREAADVYSGLHGHDGQLCCGTADCALTHYRERGGDFWFQLRDGTWRLIPAARITWAEIPGDPPADDPHRAHLCYRPRMPADEGNPNTLPMAVGDIIVFCAFISPGGV